MKKSLLIILLVCFFGININSRPDKFDTTSCIPEGEQDPIQLPAGYCYKLAYQPKLGGLSGIVRSESGKIFIRNGGNNGVKVSLLDTTTGEIRQVIVLDNTLNAQNIIGGPQDSFFIKVSLGDEVRQVKWDGTYTSWGKSPSAFPLYYTSNGRMLGTTDGKNIVEIFKDGTLKILISGLTQTYDVVGDTENTIFVTDLIGTLIKYTSNGQQSILAYISPDNTDLGLNHKDELYINNVTGFSRVDKTTGELTAIFAEGSSCSVIRSPADFVFDNSDRIIFSPWVNPSLTWVDLNSRTGGLLVNDKWESTDAVDIDIDGTLYMGVKGCGNDVAAMIVRFTVDSFKDTYLQLGDVIIGDIAVTASGGIYVSDVNETNPAIYYSTGKGQSLDIVAGSQGYTFGSLAIGDKNSHLYGSVLKGEENKAVTIFEFSEQGLINTYSVTLPKAAFNLKIDTCPDGTIYAVECEKDRFLTGPEVDIWVLKLDLVAGTSSIVANKKHTGAGPMTDIRIDDEHTIWWTLDKIYKINQFGSVTTFASNLPPDVNFAFPNSAGHIYLNCPEGLYHIWDQQSVNQGTIQLNKNHLNFGATTSLASTPSQSIYVNNSGKGSLYWSVSDNATWLTCNPESGISTGSFFVSVDASNISPGIHTGTITVADPSATNSPQTVSVTLNLYRTGHSTAPFGDFATPIDGASASGSIPVTGWVLDDLGLENVNIYRREGNNLIYIGEAIFVEGARPDVEAAYPDYPMNYQAGWGYMLLTNFLPNGGNGTYTLTIKATDIEGNEIVLGNKTITVDNAHAVKPFGAIDTPAQGGTVSGSNFVNWGWVLTPQPNSISIDGSTINVWVDGINIDHPAYNIFRSDIANLFPGYSNTDGAVGYLHLDTTSFTNGVHTIQWTASDTGGNTDGIGSRYFTVQNTGSGTDFNSLASTVNETWQKVHGDLSQVIVDRINPVYVKTGYNKSQVPHKVYPDDKGITILKLTECHRLEIFFLYNESNPNPSQCTPHKIYVYHLVNNQLRQLPAGMSIDARSGTIKWIPGVAFNGEYRFMVVLEDQNNNLKKKFFTVVIEPEFTLKAP